MHHDHDAATADDAVPDGATLARALQRLAAELRADDAAADRRRTAWLQRQAEAEASFTGVLLDLAERGRPVAVETTWGQGHVASVAVVGADVVALQVGGATVVLVRLSAVGAVRAPSGEPTSHGVSRPWAPEVTLHVLLDALAAERADVVVRTGGAPTLAGQLRWVGDDVVALRPDGPGGGGGGRGGAGVVYLQLAAITEVHTTLADLGASRP